MTTITKLQGSKLQYEMRESDGTRTLVKVHRQWSIKPTDHSALAGPDPPFGSPTMLVLLTHEHHLSLIEGRTILRDQIRTMLREVNHSNEPMKIGWFLVVGFLSVWHSWSRMSEMIEATSEPLDVPHLARAMKESFPYLHWNEIEFDRALDAIRLRISRDELFESSFYCLCWSFVNSNPQRSWDLVSSYGESRVLSLLRLPGLGALIQIRKGGHLQFIESMCRERYNLDPETLAYLRKLQPEHFFPTRNCENLKELYRFTVKNHPCLRQAVGMIKAVLVDANPLEEGAVLRNQQERIGGSLSIGLMSQGVLTRRKREREEPNHSTLPTVRVRWTTSAQPSTRTNWVEEDDDQ